MEANGSSKSIDSESQDASSGTLVGKKRLFSGLRSPKTRQLASGPETFPSSHISERPNQSVSAGKASFSSGSSMPSYFAVKGSNDNHAT